MECILFVSINEFCLSFWGQRWTRGRSGDGYKLKVATRIFVVVCGYVSCWNGFGESGEEGGAVASSA